MSQKLPAGDFIWVEKRSKFNVDFIKHCNEDSDISLKLVELKNCINFIMIYHFTGTNKNWKGRKNFSQLV